jgi:hypothetical protein
VHESDTTGSAELELGTTLEEEIASVEELLCSTLDEESSAELDEVSTELEL